MKRNYIDAINKINPDDAKLLEHAFSENIIEYCNKHNQRLSAITKQPAPELPFFGNKGI